MRFFSLLLAKRPWESWLTGRARARGLKPGSGVRARAQGPWSSAHARGLKPEWGVRARAQGPWPSAHARGLKPGSEVRARAGSEAESARAGAHPGRRSARAQGLRSGTNARGLKPGSEVRARAGSEAESARAGAHPGRKSARAGSEVRHERALAPFKADLSITRLGKFIFRVATARTTPPVHAHYTPALEASLVAACERVFDRLAAL